MPDRSELNNSAIIVANIRTGRIKLEEVTDPGDRTQLGFLIDLANEDPKFAEMVRRKELEIALKSGKRTNLVPPETVSRITPAHPSRRRQYQQDTSYQPELFSTPPPITLNLKQVEICDNSLKILDDLGLKYGSRIPSVHHDRVVAADIRHQTNILRQQLGLPIRMDIKYRQIDPKTRKTIVREIVKKDRFGLFADNSSYGQSSGFSEKVNEVAGLVSHLLDPELNRTKRNQIYHDFAKSFDKKWK